MAIPGLDRQSEEDERITELRDRLKLIGIPSPFVDEDAFQDAVRNSYGDSGVMGVQQDVVEFSNTRLYRETEDIDDVAGKIGTLMQEFYRKAWGLLKLAESGAI